MKLYVGNLDKKTTEPQLRESFEKYGEISSLNIIMDKESGKSKGFAFVEMPSDENAQSAITGMNGKELYGSMLKVNEANRR